MAADTPPDAPPNTPPDPVAGARAALDANGQLPDVELDIAGVALQLARIDAPGADWHAARDYLSELARDAVAMARELPSTDAMARAGALAKLIVGRHRYVGDTETYDDLANANLIRVIERRRGLPVALGILWLHCARAAGWGANGLDFPGHFLIAMEGDPTKVRTRHPRRQFVLDVFAGGTRLDARDLDALLKRVEGPKAELRPGILVPMSARRVLLRLQENIRSRRLMSGDPQGALSCTLDMIRLAPDDAALWRSAAIMHRQLDQVSAALRCYTRLLDLVPEGDSADRARLAMVELRARLN